MKRIILIILTISSITSAQIWERVGDMKRPVAGGDIWSHSNFDFLFVLGGYSDSVQKNVNWIQTFPEWRLDSMRASRFGFVVENYKNTAFFYGGISDELNILSRLERFGIDFTESAILDSNIIFNRIFSTGHISGDNLYIIGGNPVQGTFSDTLSYLVEYNLLRSEITHSIDTVFALDQLPEQQMSEIVGDDIFIFGGVENGISQDIHRFNIVSKVYEKLDVKLLEPRAGGRAVKSPLDDNIYIIGGYNESLEALSTVEVFTIHNESDFSIEAGPSLNEARYNFMTGILNNQIHVMGGFDTDRNVISSIEKLDEAAVVFVENDGLNTITNKFTLYDNYPNPFNPATTIMYDIPLRNGRSNSIPVTLKIYDIIGNEIATLVNEAHEPGKYTVKFEASSLSSGVYYYQLRTNSFLQTKKVILIK